MKIPKEILELSETQDIKDIVDKLIEKGLSTMEVAILFAIKDGAKTEEEILNSPHVKFVEKMDEEGIEE